MSSFFFFNDTATTEIYTLSLHDALPISKAVTTAAVAPPATPAVDAQLDAQLKEQDALILKLREQLAKLRPLAGIGESVLRKIGRAHG